MHRIFINLHGSYRRSYVSTFFPWSQKLTWWLNVSYNVFDNMVVERKLWGPRCINIMSKYHGPRKLPWGVHKLSCLRYVKYHVICTEVTVICFNNSPPPPRSPKFLGPGYICYQVCDVWVTMLFTQKLPRGYFINPSPHVKVIRTEEYKLSGMWCPSHYVIHINSC